MSDGICLRLGRRDMNTFRAVEGEGRLPVVHVAGRHAVALCPACAHPSATTNGTGWREVIDVGAHAGGGPVGLCTPLRMRERGLPAADLR